MKALLHSARIAPKKANLIARLVRGMSVPDAVEALRRTNKKGARMVEDLLRSAMANASHNDKQDPQTMIIKSIVVNQGQAYRRGMPKARGQTRPFRKFLSHITLTIGYAETEAKPEKKAKKSPSQTSEKSVQTPRSRSKAKKESPSSSASTPS
jgi:large subunit ribosomal protein L22